MNIELLNLGNINNKNELELLLEDKIKSLKNLILLIDIKTNDKEKNKINKMLINDTIENLGSHLNYNNGLIIYINKKEIKLIKKLFINLKKFPTIIIIKNFEAISIIENNYIKKTIH